MEGATSMLASALANVTTAFTAAVDMVTGNELAMVFIGMGIVSAGIGLFRRVRRG